MRYHWCKRVTGGLLAITLFTSNISVPAFASETGGSSVLCTHHQTHTEGCGYREAVEGKDCTHQHTADCYQKENCIHAHDENCGADGSNCTHICDVENGCITMQQECTHWNHDAACGMLDEDNPVCNHVCEVIVGSEKSCYALLCTHAQPDGHDEVCGYVEAVSAKDCEFICEECAKSETDDADVANVKTLVDALPTVDAVKSMDQDGQLAAHNQTQAAYDAYGRLTEEQKAQLPDAEAVFNGLFGYFNNLTAEAGSELTGKCGENLTWALSDTGILEITGTGEMYEYAQTEVSESYFIAKTTADWGNYIDQIDTIKISDGVTSIGKYAFSGCEKVSNVEIPESVKSINEGAFCSCEMLSCAVLPSGLQYIGKRAFEDSGLTRMVIPSGISQISWNTFGECHQLEEVVLPDSVTRLDMYAFSRCEKLVTVTNLGNVTELGGYAFERCSSLEKIDIPKVATIYDSVFFECKKLKEITFGQELQSIGDYAFADCTGLNKITFSGDVPAIGEMSFQDVTATAYYPADNSSWTEAALQNYGGSIAWQPNPSGGGSGTTNPEEPHTHNYSDVVTDPTCEEKGYTTHTCACGYSYVDTYIDATGHSFGEWYETKAATEEAEGEEQRNCANCDAAETRPVAKLPHNHSYSSVVTPPTCTEKGYTTYTCECSDSYVDDYVDATGHSFGEWYETKAATEKAAGEEQRSCANCDASETRSVAKLTHSHSYTSVVTPPTCTEKGYTIYTCECNDRYVDDYVDATGHSFGEWYETKAPTWETDGEERRDCICCSHYETRTRNKLFATEGTCGDNLTWALSDDGVLTISGEGAMMDYSFSSKAPWYDSERRITSVSIESGISSIGNYAFHCCSNLGSVTIPSTITRIGSNAFVGSDLIDVVIPNSVVSIDEWAFDSCRKLTDVIIQDGVVSIGSRAFQNCPSLISISIPSSITSIGDCAFDGCESLASITIPNNVTSIVGGTFRDCTSLTNVTIPNGVTIIGHWAFERCSSLSSVTIPDSVTSIGVGAFVDCISLTSVTIPDSVTSIGDYAFRNCANLDEICVVDSNKHYCSDNRGLLFNKEKTTLIQAPGKTSGSYVIPNSVTSIGSWAFYDCSSIASVTIPDSVTRIDAYAFKGCTSLTSVALPDSVTTISAGAFKDCTSLSGVTIPDSATRIDDYAFKGCTSLTSVTIPVSVTSIGSDSFNGCDSLTDVYYSGSESEWKAIQVHTGNEELLNATIHYNSTGPNTGYSGNATVRYFSKWDAANQTAYFDYDPEGDFPNFGSQVTEDTDLSFLDNVNSLIGTYVLVETKPRDDGMIAMDILLSIKPVESKTGMVTSADAASIIIGKETYAAPADLMRPETYVGKYVSYYLCDGKLVQLDIMDTTEGILIKWDPTTEKMTIRATENSGSELTYIFDGYTDQTSVAFLNAWNWQNEVYEEVTAAVNFIADGDYVYHIDGEIHHNSDFNEKIYRADYLLSDVGNNLNFYMDFIKDYSPSRMILGANQIGNASEIWREVTLVFDTFADGGALVKYEFEQADVYETILLNALEVSVDSDSAVSWGIETTKEVTQVTKTVFKGLKAILELEDDWSIATNSKLDMMTTEQKMRLKDALVDVLEEGQYTGCIFAMSDASELLDLIMDAATTVEDCVTKILTYEKLWELTDSMALVLDEMYAKTPNTSEYRAMRDALAFCSRMIKETSQEQFREGAILRAGYFAAGFTLEKGISHIWENVMDRAKAANPELAIILFAYKASRTVANMVCNVDEISEQVFKLKVINQYGAALDSATYALADRYEQNKSVMNAEALISALSLQFGLSYEDCNVAYAYADAVDDALLYKINAFITKETGKTDPLKKYSTNRKQEFHNFSVEASTFWVYGLKDDYPEWYPEYADLIDAGVADDVLVVPITSSYAIKCPVDVLVYDRNGNLIVDLSNNTAYVSDYVLAIKAGDQKYVDLYNDQEYRIACVGYDDGAMSIEISEYKGLEEIRTASFNNLSVNDEIVYETVTKTNPSDKVIHSVVCGNNVINADYDSNIQNDTSDHTHSGGTATCTKKAVCSVCGVSYGKLASHDYETSWSQGNANGHWHECKNCSAHDTQVKHTPGAGATETTAQFCTVCGYVITPALGHTCTAGTRWYSNGTYHWNLCTSCGAWVNTSYHSYSGDADTVCNVCGYIRTVAVTEPTEETEETVAPIAETTPTVESTVTETTEITEPSNGSDEILFGEDTPEKTDSGFNGILVAILVIVMVGSIGTLIALLIYKKKHRTQ